MLSKTILLVSAALAGLGLAFPSGASAVAQVQDVAWSVTGFTRYCDSFLHGCVYTFYISRSGAEPFKCQIKDGQASAISPLTQSWYAVPCNLPWNPDEGWEISWGYNEKNDYAVMTVVNKNIKNIAWFGWAGINNSQKTSFPDAGPNAVFQL